MMEMSMGSDKTSEWLSNARSDIEDSEAISGNTTNAILDFLDAYNPDAFHIDPPRNDSNGREDTLAASSRLAYARALRDAAKHLDLLSCSTRDLNRHANKLLSGDLESVKDDGLSQNSVHQKQIAWRKFARFHQNHPQGVDINLEPDDIALVDREETSVDERDMFDSEEIKAMRQACQNKRDRALLELLIYTGQRHNALRSLKVKDVQPDEGESGVLYLPDVDEGLKGAEGKRPLLGAQKACREWKRSHPTGDPEDYFITHVYDWAGHDDIEPGDQLSRHAIGDIPKRIGERAGVEKPLNPHNFRHYFTQVSVAKHGMSMDTVRHLLGHAKDSRELERTYQHLVDDDYIESAEVSMDIQDGHDETFTPPQCFTCNEPLDPSWSVCPNCEHTYGPDAKKVQDEINDAETETAMAATTDQEKTDVQHLLDEVDDPRVINQLVALSKDLDDEGVLEAFGDSSAT